MCSHCGEAHRRGERGRVGETYNVGGREERENLGLVKHICELIDAAFAADPQLRERFRDAPAAKGIETARLISFVSDRPGHDRRYAIDCSKIEKELQFQAKTNLEDGLRCTLNWYLSNESWWRSVMDGSYRDWVEEQYGA